MRCLMVFTMVLLAASAVQGEVIGAHAAFENGPPNDPSFFPIGVWLQHPKRAAQYKAAGINTYVGLWKGPTEEQLSALSGAGMHVICDQNKVGLESRNNDVIIGWMHGDEPDNAQSLGQGKGYGPPVAPEKIVEDYQRIRAADPSRPVLLNLGQGVAWDGWRGRGVRTNHPEDYARYVEGCDIASFDIYPVVHRDAAVAGNLWYVGRGVERLRKWTPAHKPVWNVLECTHISSADKKPTPAQVRSEAWMSIIHGSKGIIYFVHEWQPRFNEAALLDDPELLAAVTEINREITELAPALNAPDLEPAPTVETDIAPIAVLAKRHDGDVYIFAAAMRDADTKARISVPGVTGDNTVEVLGEGRELKMTGGVFRDSFLGYGVHLYRVNP